MTKRKREINRYLIVAVGFSVFFVAVLGRLFYLQVMRHEFYSDQAREQHYGSIKLPAKRGEILLQDPRSGSYYKLATNITQDLVYVDPQFVENERDVADKLSVLIYEHICSGLEKMDCTKAVDKYTGGTNLVTETVTVKGQKKEIQKEVTKEKDQLIADISRTIYTKISEKEVTKVVFKKFYFEKPEDEVLREKVKSLNIEGVFVSKEEIFADPTRIRNKEQVAAQLSPLLDFSTDDMIVKLTRRSSRYVPLANRLQAEISDKIEALKLKGIVLVPEHWRFYPENDLAASIVGFMDTSSNPQYGIERKFDAELRGVEGEIESTSDPFGRNLTVGESNIKPAKDGSSIVLTLDRGVQAEVQKRLKKAVEDYRADSGSVIVMDPFTGEIVASAQYPGFDPNKYSDAYKTKEINFDPGKTMTVLKELGDKKYLTYENKFGPSVFFNSIVGVPYEPGSIFKPVTVAIGIDSGEISPNTTYYDKGELTVDEYTIHNVSQACLGTHDMTHALNYSCNIGMASIAKKLGKSLFYNYLVNFGFGERTDVELDEEEKGFLKYFRNWAASNLLTISFGQGITVTPLQMAVSYSALANGGLILQPHIVREVIHPDGKSEKSGVDIIRRVISKDTADTVTAMLISSVEQGVARKARLDHYYVAGKTGTAQIALEGKAGFEEGNGSTIAGFGGYFPANNPKLVMIVKIVRPRSSPWGDATAAPLFQELATFMADYYNLPPDR